MLPAKGMADEISDVEVCGELECQFRGAGEFVPVYAELGRGALSLCLGQKGGELISTVRVPDLAALRVRPPRTPRHGRPHCLRIDLPEGCPDSQGVRKYIFDLGAVVNMERWQRSLTAASQLAQPEPETTINAEQLVGMVGGWLDNLRLNLLVGGEGDGDGEDDLRRQMSAELSPRARSMIAHHKAAQLEVVHNSIVAAKRAAAARALADSGSEGGCTHDATRTDSWVVVDDKEAYKQWLQISMPGDYDNEFISCSRKNEVLHEQWAATAASEELRHLYTDTDTNNINPDRVERMCRVEFAPMGELLREADELAAAENGTGAFPYNP